MRCERLFRPASFSDVDPDVMQMVKMNPKPLNPKRPNLEPSAARATQDRVVLLITNRLLCFHESTAQR